MTAAIPEGISQNFEQLDAQLRTCEEQIAYLLTKGKETKVTHIKSVTGEGNRKIINDNVLQISNLVKVLRGIAGSEQELNQLQTHITKLRKLGDDISNVNQALAKGANSRQPPTTLNSTQDAIGTLSHALKVVPVIRALQDRGIGPEDGQNGKVLAQRIDAEGNNVVHFQYKDAAGTQHPSSITVTHDGYEIGGKVFRSIRDALNDLGLKTAETKTPAIKTESQKWKTTKKATAESQMVKGRIGAGRKQQLCEQFEDFCEKGNVNDATSVAKEIGPNTVDRKGRTLLQIACDHGAKNIAEMLIKQGANVNSQDNKGNTPLHMACAYGYVEIAQLLIKNGAKSNLENNKKRTPLHMGCRYKREEIVELLLENKNVDLMVQDAKGDTPLSSACYSGISKEVIAKLADAEKKAINILGARGAYPLQWACYLHHHEIANVLIDRNAQVNAQGNLGITPLHMACLSATDSEQIIDTLLDRGANINLQDDDRKTPLHLVLELGKMRMAKKLIECNADVTLQDKFNNLPLHIAIAFSSKEVIQQLIAKTTHTNQKNTLGYTPLDLAAARGDTEIFTLIANAVGKEEKANTSIPKQTKSRGEWEAMLYPSQQRAAPPFDFERFTDICVVVDQNWTEI